MNSWTIVMSFLAWRSWLHCYLLAYIMGECRQEGHIWFLPSFKFMPKKMFLFFWVQWFNATQVVYCCVWVQTLFQSVTNGKEKFSRLLFCRLKSDCRRTLGTESVRILKSTAQDPCISDGYNFLIHLKKAPQTQLSSLCICLFLLECYDCM